VFGGVPAARAEDWSSSSSIQGDMAAYGGNDEQRQQ